MQFGVASFGDGLAILTYILIERRDQMAEPLEERLRCDGLYVRCGGYACGDKKRGGMRRVDHEAGMTVSECRLPQQFKRQ